MSKFYTQDCLIYCVFLSKEFQLKFFIETSAHRFLNVLSTNSKEFTTYKPNLRTWLQPTLSPLSLCFPSQYKIYITFSKTKPIGMSQNNDDITTNDIHLYLLYLRKNLFILGIYIDWVHSTHYWYSVNEYNNGYILST